MNTKPTSNSPWLHWQRRHLKKPITGVLIACFAVWSVQLRGATANWILDGNGNWTNTANWQGGFVGNAINDVANFNVNLTANRTITLDAPITIGSMMIGDALGLNTFTFAGGNALTLDVSSGNASINKFNSTTDTWQAPLIMNDALNANIFAGTFDVNGASNAQVAITSTGLDLNKNGSGTLRLNLDASNFSGRLVLNLGTLTIGGGNAAAPTALGTNGGADGILLKGSGVAGQSVLTLANNGAGSNGTITYAVNNDVTLAGAATINVAQNYIGGANTGNTIVLDKLSMNGILAVTGANTYGLRFDGVTTLAGQTSVFSPGSATLTLNGVIDDGAISRALIKENTGRMIIGNTANTYDGVTAVKDGLLQMAPNAVTGLGKTYVNGGVLVLASTQQAGTGTLQGGLELVSQIGTSRAVLPVIGIGGATGYNIDSGNLLNVNVPFYGMAVGIDGNFSTTIDLSQIGTGGSDSNRVSVMNVGGDRTFTGTILPAADSNIRIHNNTGTFIIAGANSLGGATPSVSTGLIAGLSNANALVLPGVAITLGSGGIVSVRNNNALTGPVTVNRGVTLNINGAFTTPLGTGVVTSLGGAITTDANAAATAAKFGNTDFQLYGGASLLLDNSAIVTANTDARLLPATNIDLTTSTLRLLGDGGAATTSSQTVASIDYFGGSTISVDTDAAIAGRLTSLTTGTLNRGTTRGTLNIRNTANTATTFGTSAGTQKLIITASPTVTNGMIGANIALWAGANSNDAGDSRFASYDATHGIQAATMVTATTAANLQAAPATQITDFNGVAGTTTLTGNASMQALRLRTTANTQVLSSGTFTLTLGSSAAVGQGAGLQLNHTSNDTVTHPLNLAFGTQEGLIYTATTGGTAGIVALTGVISGSNGITKFGDGILRLQAANNITGGITVNSGELRLNSNTAGGIYGNPTSTIDLWGGFLNLELTNTRFNNNVSISNDARLGNNNVAGTGFNNLTVNARTGSTAPIVLDLRSGGNQTTTAYGSLTLNGPAQPYVTHLFQVNGGLAGAGNIEKFGNERFFIGGDSSAYSGNITINTGGIYSLNASATALPFGSSPITINPGGALRLAAATNIGTSQVTMNSDAGGISGLAVSYVDDPAALASSITANTTAPWRGFVGISTVGFNQNIDQSSLWGGNVYLGAVVGDTGIYTGTLTPAAGNQFLLGTGQGAIRIAKPLTGASNSVVIGVNMTGDVGRASQVVNNSGGAVQFDVPMTYGGDTTVHPNITLRLSAANATTGIGAITLNGGTLQADSTVGQLRMVGPLTIANAINLNADSTIQMQNNASDFRLTGPVNLASNSNGVVRQLSIGADQPGAAANNAGNLYLDGGIADGPGSSGNHFIKAGIGTIMLTGTQTYTGSTTIAGGILGINGDADLASSSQIVMNGGGIGVYENSFTTSRNYTINSGNNGLFDVMGGLTLTQVASSTIDGPNFILKRGLGTLVLNGSNAQAGIAALDGILQINSQASLGDPVSTSASGIQIGGDFLVSGANNNTRYTGGTLRIAADMVTARGITFNNNGNTNFGGGIDVTSGTTFALGGILAQGSEFDFAFKTGAGTLVINSSNLTSTFTTTNASTSVTTGNTIGLSAGMLVTGTGIAAGTMIAAITSTTAFTLSANATAGGAVPLNFVNNSSNLRQFAITNGTVQFSNSGPWTNSTATATDVTNIEFVGGTVRAINASANIALANAASTTNYNYGGGAHLRMESGAGFSVEFLTDNLNRVNQGTLVLEAINGTTLGGAGATNAGRLIAQTAFNGVARASMLGNGIFSPHIIAADATGVAGFVTNDATTGFVPYAGATVSSISGLAPTAIADISAPQTLTGINSVYALRTSADISGGTLVIPNVGPRIGGGILLNGSNTISSNVVFDPANSTAPVSLTGGSTTASSNAITVASTSNLVVGMGVTGTNIPAGSYITAITSATAFTINNNATAAGTSLTFSAYEGSNNSGEALLYVKTGENAAITGTTTAGSLTKFGAGTLTVSNASVPGDISVQEGTLKLGGSLNSRMNSELNLNASATFDLNGNNAVVETLGSNNRQVATQNVGGTVTNTGASASLRMASPASSTFTGMINGALKLQKAGAGTLTIDGYRASTPDSGMNTYTGGTDIYGIGTTGGITLDNATFGLGGANGSSAGDVNLYGGTLALLFSNTTTAINGTQGQLFSNQVVKFGAESGLGYTVNVRGPGQINVNQGSVSVTGQGNLMQIGNLNLSNTTLSTTGGNLYRLRVAGTTTIQGGQAAISTTVDGPAAAVEFAGIVTGSGTLTKLTDGNLRGIVLMNPGNTYSGGTNIIGGDVQVTATSGTPLGSGAVRVFPTGTLRIAANTSVDALKLKVMSGITQLGAVVLDNNFTPNVLTAANFGSVYNTTLQVGQPYWTQPLNLATIGDGRAFLGAGVVNDPIRYMASSLGAGAEDAWNPGVGVYRVVGGVTNFAFEGVNNVFTGNSYLQVGPQRGMVLGGLTNGGNAVIIRNSNNFTGGTQIAEGTVLLSEVGGSPIGETPLGTGAVEIYGEYRIQSALGSAWNAATSAPTNADIRLRPAGLIRVLDTTGNLAAGGQGRWGDSVGLDLNGGQFRYDGAVNWQSVETMGDITVRKGGILTVARGNAASSAQLNIGTLTRVDRGSLTLSYNSGFLGVNSSTPDSFERLTTTTVLPLGGNTANGTGATNGIVAPWIIDRTTASFVGYNATTGFQPVGNTVALAGGASSAGSPTFTVTSTTGMRVGMVVSGTGIPAGATVTAILSATQFTLNQNASSTQTAQNYTTAPAAGEIAYNKNVTGALTAGGLVAGDIADISTAAKTLADNPTLYALRSNQNISPTAVNNTMTLSSGGLILTGGTINPTGAITAGVVSPMTLNFGAAGAGEALIYVGTATSTIQAQINAALGFTKMGPNQLTVQSINPGNGAPVVINEGTVLARVPVSGTGTAVSGVFNNQDIILNGGSLLIPSNLANAAGTASEIASNINVTGTLGGNIFVRADATIGNNSLTQYTRIGNLTVANAAGSPAMDGNGVIALGLAAGIWVTGTTTLSPQARINATFPGGIGQNTFEGQVTGVGAPVEKFGNGAITFLNGTNNYSGGTIIHGAGAATASSTVASGFRGTGTPFGSGAITINPGGYLRIADNANIASNAVTLKSDDFSLGGISIAHNGALPSFITSGTPAAGQVKVESTGPFAGVIGLDYGYYSQPLNMASIPGGDWWLGNSQQSETFYLNPTLGTASSGKYLLGGGGNQSGITFGGVLVSGGRTPVFEYLFAGGTAGQVKVEIGAQTGDFAWNAPAYINGNTGLMTLLSRNTGLVGDVRVNTSATLIIGNSFALGSGRLIMNGGNVRTDFGVNNFAGGVVTLNNTLVLQGDYNAVSGGDLVYRGPVAMSEVAGAGATRTFNVNSGTTAFRGIVSGAAGSNLIKTGAGTIILAGANTYEGFTQISAGNAYIVGDVKPGLAGPLGISDSAINLNGGVLRSGGRLEIARDILVSASSTLDTAVHDRTLVSGAISIASTFTLTVGAAGADNTIFRGGNMQITGAISGGGALTVGTTTAAPGPSGTVNLLASSNGYGINTYAGGTTLQTARLQIASDTYYTGPATNPLIISGPLGTGAITFGAGEGNRGGTIEAVGGPRTIVNAFNAISVAANTTHTFTGRESLTFVRNLDLSSDATLRSRSFAVQNLQQPVTFSGILSASGAAGVDFIKTGPGKLILSGANTFATSTTTGLRINSGIVSVNADAAMGAAGQVRLAGGILSASDNINTARQAVLVAASGIDVASGKTLALSAATTGAFGITKSGPGMLSLNNAANTITTLTLGGVAQLKPEIGYAGVGGGIVSSNAASGTPFATTSVTINGGVLALNGTTQSLSIPTVNYGAIAAIALSTGSTITASTAFARLGTFNTVNYGTLTVSPTALANLGVTEKLLVTTGAPANTAGAGGDILTTPSIFVRLAATNSDANFARYDATNGIREHGITTVPTLTASAATNVADITGPDTAGTGNIDIQALRTTADITPTDGTTLVRLARGGLIFNGSNGAAISAPVLFGTGAGAALTEAIVYAREGQTVASSLTGGLTARDFTKTGPGALNIGGTANLLNSNAVRLPVVSVQDGTLRLSSLGANFQNQLRGTTLGDYLGHYALNVNEAGVFDLNGLNVPIGGLSGNGTISSGVAGNATLTVKNGFGVDMTFNGLISNGSGTVSLLKTQDGILTLAGHGTYTGGTTIEAGRVTNGIGSTAANGRLEVQTVTALGSGPITLAGGTLRLNSASLLNGAQSSSEVGNAVDYLQYGPGSGYNITISNTASTNGVALPANISSTLEALTNNAGINNLIINAPMLTTTQAQVLQVNGTTTFSQADTVLRTAGGRFFFAGQILASGNTITKTGANDIVLTNSASNLAQNQVGLWKIYGGLVEARTTNGASNPFGANPVIEVNAGSTTDARGVRFYTDGDGTSLGERITTYADSTLRIGSMLPVSSSQFVASGASRIQADRAFIANNSWKTVELASLQVGGALGGPYVYFVTNNNDSFWIQGQTTFMRDLTIQADTGMGITFNALISGNGTVNRRSNGATVYFNADNSTGYSGGTFFTGSGRNYLGSIEGSQVSLSNTAKLGKGHVYAGPLALFQINDAGNLQTGQNIYASGNLSWFSNFSLAADLPLEQVRLRSLGLGGIQNGSTDYFLSASNPSSGVLSLGTVYTQALDQRRLGDGMWWIGSSTNGVGANGVYNAATLAPGLSDTYRLGAGTNTLFIGTNGNANVLTDVNAGKTSSLAVGSPITVQSMGVGSWGNGTLVLMNGQNYTGSTLVNISSTLDFRGTLTTSGIKTYGTVNVAGEAGTFINPVTNANIPVTLRPGATLRFDNTTAGVLPTTATEGRWQDSVGIALTDNVLRLQGNTAVEVNETVGAITAGAGGNRIEIVRGVVGRTTTLTTPSITRTAGQFGTLQLIHNGSTLGSDERLMLSGAAPTITNGMVDAWMFSATDVQFLTYNSANGFFDAGFDHTFATTATLTTSVSAPTARAFFSAVPTLNGADYTVQGLRIDADVNLTTATAATDTTNRLVISGTGGVSGLLVNGARTVQTGIWAGASGTNELMIYNNNTLNVGILANNTTSGRIRANGLTKTGSGTLVILSEQPDLTGDIRIQQGTLQFNANGAATDTVSAIAGNTSTTSNIIFQGNNTALNLRIGDTPFTAMNFTIPRNIVIGDQVSVATINYDRIATVTGKNIYFNNLTFGANEGDNGQVLRLVNPTGGVGYRLHFNGTTTLAGRSSFAVDNNYSGSANEVFLNGQVTGTGTLVKGASDSRTRTLTLQNLAGANNFSGGTVLQGGNLLVLANAQNVGANASGNITAGGLGSGALTLMQGTLDLRLDSTQLIDKTGTYTRSGTTVTVTSTAHGYANGQVVLVTNGPETGPFVITSVADANTFTYTSLSSGTVAATPFSSQGPDTHIEFDRYTSGSGAGLDLNLNGSVAINGDRNTYQGTWTRSGSVVTMTLPGGHSFVTGQSLTVATGGGPNTGNFTITGVSGNTLTYTDATGTAAAGNAIISLNAGSNKMLTFNNLTFNGSPALTLTNGNGYGFAVEGTTTFKGSPIINNASEFVIGGAAGAGGAANSITTGGGGIIVDKINTGTLWIHSTNNNLNATLYVNAGLLDWGNRQVGNNTATFGINDIYVNPGAGARIRAATNLNTAQGQEMVLTSTPYSSALLRLVGSFNQAQIQSFVAPRTTTSNEVSYISFEGNLAAANLDQSLIGDGRVYFGTIGNRTYAGAATGSALTPGLANLPNAVVGGTSANRVYRLASNDGSTLTVNLTAAGAGLGDVGGATDVQIGSMAILGPTNWNNGFVYFQDQNTYTGQTTVSRGVTLRFNTGMNAGNTAGPLGANASAPVHVYGGLRIESGGSLNNNAGTAAFYTNVLLHPVSNLTFQDTNTNNRWLDTASIALDGSSVTATGTNSLDNATETVGAITFDRGARVNLNSQGTGDSFFTAGTLTRAAASLGEGTGRGTLVIAPTATAALGAAASAGAAQQQFYFANAASFPTTSAVTGMLPGFFMDGNGHRYLTYTATGVLPVPDASMTSFTAGMTAGTAVVNITANATLPDFNPVIYALRGGAFTLNSPTGANNDATITLAGSGTDIGSVSSFGAFVINPNLKFGSIGTNEAIFYTGSTLTVNGSISAGSITKFGTGGTLVIANDQSDAARGTGLGYSGGWIINEGTVQFGQFGSAGNAVAGNKIVLNGSNSASAQVNLRAQPADSLLNYTYTSGRIIAVDNATLDWDPGANDRVHSIADLEIQQSGGIGNAAANGTQDALFRVTTNTRLRSILSAGSLTITNNAVLNVDSTITPSTLNAYANNAAYLTNGVSTGLSVSQLIGTERLTKWGDGYLYIRGASNSFSGAIVIDQGAVQVTDNGSLGTGAITVNRYGVLDIGIANYVPTNSSLTNNEGSIERWSVNGARSGNVDLGKATLQVAADQPTTSANLTLNGGGIEAWIRNDDNLDAQYSGGVLRVLNPNVNVTLAGDSYVGARYYLGANGLDLGKQTHDNRPLEEYVASGAILEVQGTISGPGKLTKAGYDTVILSGANTYSGGTAIEGGKLMIGRDNALPTTTNLTTTANGILDLNGQNQTVATLTNPGTPATVVNSTSGFITNSATAVNTLTVGNTVTTDFTYAGVIQHNVALTKTGTAVMTLTNANTYSGSTQITGGTLKLALNGSINDSPWVNVGGGAQLDLTAKSGGYTFDGTVTGGGTDAAGTTFATVGNAARIIGTLTMSDNVGEISLVGKLAPGGSSSTTDITTAGNQIGHLYTSADVTLGGAITGSSPAAATTRLSMQLNGATTNLSSLGYTSGDVFAFIANLPFSSPTYLNGATGNLAGHDYLNVAGALTLAANGRISVSNFGSYSPGFGDLFNLIDWGTVNLTTWTVANDLTLPVLGSGMAWDTSQFTSSGVIVVVPEPSRVLLMLLGVFALVARRRRR